MQLSTITLCQALSVAHDLGQQSLKRRCLRFATRDEAVLKQVQESLAFENLSADLVRELFVYAHGNSKRRRSDVFEFDNGTNWPRLSFVQLQRACDERGLPSLGERNMLLAQLEASA